MTNEELEKRIQKASAEDYRDYGVDEQSFDRGAHFVTPLIRAESKQTIDDLKSQLRDIAGLRAINLDQIANQAAEIEHLKIQIDQDNGVIDAAREKIEKLKRIISKELTENDELGAEYTYVLYLKEEIASLTEQVSLLRTQHEYWHDHLDLTVKYGNCEACKQDAAFEQLRAKGETGGEG